jgi:peptidoglycan/xylan/chitin deacetylase (PgdA/CDA1 family)
MLQAYKIMGAGLAIGCGLGAAGISTAVWGAVAPWSQLYGPALWRLPNKREIALTFDDGPNPSVTPALLELLQEHAAQATFFLMGSHVRRAKQLAREIVTAGHAIGNHTETHPNLALLGAARIMGELEKCTEAIGEATGERVKMMRPPFGFRGPQLPGALRQAGLTERVIMWSAMARDWKAQDASRVIRRLERVRGGDIVLLHDGDHRMLEGQRMHTVQALEYWVPRWKDAGYSLVSLNA